MPQLTVAISENSGFNVKRCKRKGGKAAAAGQGKDAIVRCHAVEAGDASDESCCIGKVEIADAVCNAGLDQMVGGGTRILKRSGGIDNEIGFQGGKDGGRIAVAIHRNRLKHGFGSHASGKGLRLVERAPGNQQRQSRLVGQKPHQPATECAVATEDQDAQPFCAHAINRARCSGVGTKQVFRRPAIR
jgi:hypothetical protein